AAGGDGRSERVDRRDDVDRGAERSATRISVVAAFRAKVDFRETQARETGDDAGSHPFALGVDDLSTGGNPDADAGGDDAAVAHDNGAALLRVRSVSPGDDAVGDGDGLRRRGNRGCSQQCSEDAETDHLASPSPGWPSSKSLTGRRCGLLASNISAPSIHTRSGRV